MKLLKEDGMIDEDVLEDLCWELRMANPNLKPIKNGVFYEDPMLWEQNKLNVKMIKSCLEHVRQSTNKNRFVLSVKNRCVSDLVDLQEKVEQLSTEYKVLECEHVTLKEKMQEAQITAGLFIQSVKEKLPSWFKKD